MDVFLDSSRASQSNKSGCAVENAVSFSRDGSHRNMTCQKPWKRPKFKKGAFGHHIPFNPVVWFSFQKKLWQFFVISNLSFDGHRKWEVMLNWSCWKAAARVLVLPIGISMLESRIFKVMAVMGLECGGCRPYCWWLKSQTTTWDVWNPINNGKNYLSTGAGFQPSTVCSDFMWFYGCVLFYVHFWRGFL